MNKYEQQNVKGKKAKRGKFLLWTGIIITIVAIVFLIIGFASIVTYAIIGAFVLVIGITATIYGLQLKKQGKSIDRGIVTVKCRKCGFLERAGAEFCSKCGQTMP
ncbi:MAG: hypothetical protein ACTSRE_12300 [Promethearchaeota archaeon]